MKTIGDVRRDNLELLIKEKGSLEAVVQAEGVTSSTYLSQVRNRYHDIKTGKPREMGTAMARRLEERCGKPDGWMDHPHEEARELQRDMQAGRAVLVTDAKQSTVVALFEVLQLRAAPLVLDEFIALLKYLTARVPAEFLLDVVTAAKQAAAIEAQNAKVKAEQRAASKATDPQPKEPHQPDPQTGPAGVQKRGKKSSKS